MDRLESRSAERLILLEAVNDLRRERLLDWTGGAISLRVGSSAMLITPGGSARRLWKLLTQDLIYLPLHALRTSTGQRLPIGTALHQFLYRELPDVNAIVHTHAGCCYTASCLASAGLPILAPTSPLGDVPCISDSPSNEHNRPSTQTDWVTDVTIPAVSRYMPLWVETTRKRGVVFFDRDHGAYTLGRSVDAALVDLARLESSSRLWLQANNGRGLPDDDFGRPELPN